MMPTIVTKEVWLNHRLELLEKEKEFNRLRDELSAQRRTLPWVKIEKDYGFQTADGQKSLIELFADKSQLIIYHFMFGPAWVQGCPSCSFWADNFNGIHCHLAARDISFHVIGRADYQKLSDYKNQMDWQFDLISSHGSDFNFDFDVSFDPENAGTAYNYRPDSDLNGELPGVSIFVKHNAEVYHTYSTYARGLDMLNGAYHFIDLTPKGRDEEDLPFAQAWVKRHDEY